jgi:hypothetical protein
MAKTAVAPLKENDRVVVTEDLRGVPRGTTGKVIQVQGLSWIRYWVWFDNGVRMGTLDRSKLSTLDEWLNKANASSSELVSVGAGAADGAGPAGGGDASGDVGGVPGHLLERSRSARARWAAKKG